MADAYIEPRMGNCCATYRLCACSLMVNTPSSGNCSCKGPCTHGFRQAQMNCRRNAHAVFPLDKSMLFTRMVELGTNAHIAEWALRMLQSKVYQEKEPKTNGELQVQETSTRGALSWDPSSTVDRALLPTLSSALKSRTSCEIIGECGVFCRFRQRERRYPFYRVRYGVQ